MGSTKLTAVEAELLRRKHGTVHSGLRAAVNAYLGNAAASPAKKTRKVLEEPAVKVAREVSDELEKMPPVMQCRIHRNYKVVDRWFENGQEWSRRRCADCGHETASPDHG